MTRSSLPSPDLPPLPPTSDLLLETHPTLALPEHTGGLTVVTPSADYPTHWLPASETSAPRTGGEDKAIAPAAAAGELEVEEARELAKLVPPKAALYKDGRHIPQAATLQSGRSQIPGGAVDQDVLFRRRAHQSEGYSNNPLPESLLRLLARPLEPNAAKSERSDALDVYAAVEDYARRNPTDAARETLRAAGLRLAQSGHNATPFASESRIGPRKVVAAHERRQAVRAEQLQRRAEVEAANVKRRASGIPDALMPVVFDATTQRFRTDPTDIQATHGWKQPDQPAEGEHRVDLARFSFQEYEVVLQALRSYAGVAPPLRRASIEDTLEEMSSHADKYIRQEQPPVDVTQTAAPGRTNPAAAPQAARRHAAPRRRLRIA